MDDPSDLYLTEDRIRAVAREASHFYKKARSRAGQSMLQVPSTMPDIAAGETLINVMSEQFDATMGPGGGRFMADSTRLQFLLGVLEQGTVGDAVAALKRRTSRFDTSRIDPALVSMMRGNEEIHEARLRAIPQSEIDAVLACLDEIATVYPGQAQSVRARHNPAVRDGLEQAAITLRTGDPSRPQLTEDRIRRVLDVLSAIVPGPKMLVRSLHDGTFALYGKTAAQLFPKTTVKKIRELGEDPDVFARVFGWLMLIAGNIGRGDSIVDRIRDVLPKQDPEAWMSAAHTPAAARARAERFAAMMSGPLELLCRVGYEEEAAVKSLLGEIQARLRSARQIQIETNQRSRGPEA
jgi:hypothetical protein